MRHRCVDRPGVGPALAATIAVAAIFAGPAAGQTISICPSCGADPYQVMLLAGQGTLYLETPNGSIYSVTTPPNGGWAIALLYAAPANTGAVSGLAMDASGALYGLALSPGYPDGFAYKLTPPAKGRTAWTYTHIHNFTGADGNVLGSGPNRLSFGIGGSLYGTTAQGGNLTATYCAPKGCGVVFKLNPPVPGKTAWSETVLHKFAEGADGYAPEGGIAIDGSGSLYGTAAGGTRRHGVVYRVAPPASAGGSWVFSTLRSMKTAEGLGLLYGVIPDGSGGLFGTGTRGGAHGAGTVYHLTPPAQPGEWTATVLYSFTAGDTGNGGTGNPWSGVFLGPSGQLYGEANIYSPRPNGTTLNGSIFTLTPPAAPGGDWTESSYLPPAFAGLRVAGGLVGDSGGHFYGTTFGPSGVFEYTP